MSMYEIVCDENNGRVYFSTAEYGVFDLTDLLAEHDRRVRNKTLKLVASTLAHEINNRLAPVTGYAALIEADPETDFENRLAAIKKAADSIADFVAQFGRHARQGTLVVSDSPVQTFLIPEEKEVE